MGRLSAYANWISRVIAEAFDDPKVLARVVFAYFLILSVVYGVRFVDIAEDVIMWRDVSAAALPAPHQYQIFTPLPIIIGHYLVPYNAPSVAIAYVLIGLLGVFGSMAVVWRSEQGLRRAIYVFFLLGAHVFYHIYSWLGVPDGFIVFFYVCAYFTRRNIPLSALLLTCAFLTHPTQGLILLCVHAGFSWLEGHGKPGRYNGVIATALALAAGYGLNELYIQTFHLTAAMGRIDWMESNVLLILASIYRNPLISAYAAYALVWIAIIARAVQPGNLRYAALVLLPLAGSFGTDVTRLMVILGMPTILFTADYFASQKAEETKAFIIKYAPILVPLSLVFYQVTEGGNVSSINWVFWLWEAAGAPTDLRPVGP